MRTETPDHIIEDRKSVLEQYRNTFLAALYEKDNKTAFATYRMIVDFAKSHPGFSENDEKRLRQIQLIYRRFKPGFEELRGADMKALFKRLKTLLADQIKRGRIKTSYKNFAAWEENLSLCQRQKNLIYKTAVNFQLSSGCSHFCRRCNEWALPGIRSHFSFEAVLLILNYMMRQHNKEIALYSASDPLEWRDDKKTILDIIAHLKNSPLSYSLLTKVPESKQGLLKSLIKTEANISVSVTAKNKSRVLQIEKSVGRVVSKQHDLDVLFIPAGQDEDFKSVKPSITDGYGVEITPDGAFIIIPTFTSALHPFGHQKIKVTQKTSFFPIKKTGRHALLADYFKPLQGYDLNQNICYLNHLLDVQVESILLDTGEYTLTPPGMRSIKEYFSIFEDTARLQRKQMTSSVINRLKKEFLGTNAYKHLPLNEKIQYRKKIQSHFSLCRRQKCMDAKIHAFSYFLDAILKYRKRQPEKSKIIKNLLADEMIVLNAIIMEQDLMKKPVTHLIRKTDIDTFELFRCAVTMILIHKNPAVLSSFVETHRAVYDSTLDIFIKNQ